MHKIRAIWISLISVFMLVAGCSDSDSPTGPESGTEYPTTDDYTWRVHATESHFTQLSGCAADDIYALTRDNVIFHFDGTSWRNTIPFPDITCYAEYCPLWVTADGVLFLGCGETVYRYDGSEWFDMQLSPGVVVAGLWGTTSDDVIAVGADGKGHRAASVIFHYDGNEWSSVPHDVTKPLTAVHGTPWGGHIFAAGEEGAFVHYDGSNWVTLSAPTRRDFKALWAAGQNLVVAVGDAGTIVHYDGEAFEVMSTGTIWSIRAVWGNGPDDIYAGGEVYTMLYYDGTSWSPMKDPPYAVEALWTTPEGILFAGTTHGGIRSYANANWTTAFAMQKGWMSELWAASHDDVYVSGITNVLHYDGTSWQQATTRPSYAFYSEGIGGTSSSDVWVVWSNGVIQRRYGASWAIVPNYTGATLLRDVWAAAPNDAYAVGESHVIHWDGSVWSTVAVSVDYAIAVDGSGPGHAFIVGIHGQILALDGEHWVEMHAPGDENLNDVSVVDENTAYVAVHGGGMLVFDGQEWTRMATPVEFRSIWAPAKDEVFGLQYRTGDIYRWNGYQWELVQRALRFPFNGRKIWGHSREGFWVVGNLEHSGVIIEYQLVK